MDVAAYRRVAERWSIKGEGINASAAAVLILQLCDAIESRWISVTERLPAWNVNVLVYIPASEEKTFIASLDEGGMWFSSDPTADAYSLGEDGAPTHWMPLPEPPSDDK